MAGLKLVAYGSGLWHEGKGAWHGVHGTPHELKRGMQVLWLYVVKAVVKVCEVINGSSLWEVLGSQSLPCGALSSMFKQLNVSIASPLLCVTS